MRYNLRRHVGDRARGVNQASPLEEARETQCVVVDVAHDHATRASPGEWDQLTKALRTSVSVDVDHPALPTGAYRGDGCGKRLPQAVAWWHDHQRHSSLSARRNELCLVVTGVEAIAEGRAQARQSSGIGDESQDGGCMRSQTRE